MVVKMMSSTRSVVLDPGSLVYSQVAASGSRKATQNKLTQMVA